MKLVQDQLAEERNTKTSLETRAVAVVTTSGTLVTLLFALAALVTKNGNYTLPAASRWSLIIALAGFLVAAVLAILAARPQAYHEVTPATLREITTADAWHDQADEAEPGIAAGLVDIIIAARAANARKASLLKKAVFAEVMGVIGVGVAVTVILILSR